MSFRRARLAIDRLEERCVMHAGIDGSWVGITGQGLPISFEVADHLIGRGTSISYRVCEGDSPSTLTIGSKSFPISEDHEFSFVAGIPPVQVSGAFDADSSGGGTLSVTKSCGDQVVELNATWRVAPAVPGVSLSPLAEGLAEGGAAGSYGLVLTSKPSAEVTVSLLPDLQTSVDPPNVTFTPSNWNVRQQIAVSAVDDFVAEGKHGGLITHAVTSADPQYDGLIVPNVVAVLTDNDTAGVEVMIPSDALIEGGPPAGYEMRLTSQPSSDVTIEFASNSQFSVEPQLVTFTPGNWNAPRLVNVTATEDFTPEGNHQAVIVHTVQSGDPLYEASQIAQLVAPISDTTLLGDANRDGKVDLTDFGILKQHFGSNGGWSQGNFDGPGTVDLTDFGILKQAFGSATGGALLLASPAVPTQDAGFRTTRALQAADQVMTNGAWRANTLDEFLWLGRDAHEILLSREVQPS